VNFSLYSFSISKTEKINLKTIQGLVQSSRINFFSLFFSAINNNSNSLFLTLIPLSGVGTTCFSSCCDKDSEIVFSTGRLPDESPPYNWSGYKRLQMHFYIPYKVPRQGKYVSFATIGSKSNLGLMTEIAQKSLEKSLDH
jgi:hypothetical protein